MPECRPSELPCEKALTKPHPLCRTGHLPSWADGFVWGVVAVTTAEMRALIAGGDGGSALGARPRAIVSPVSSYVVMITCTAMATKEHGHCRLHDDDDMVPVPLLVQVVSWFPFAGALLECG